MTDDDIRARFRAVSAVADRRPLPDTRTHSGAPAPRRRTPVLLVAACTAALVSGLFVWSAGQGGQGAPSVAGGPTPAVRSPSTEPAPGLAGTPTSSANGPATGSPAPTVTVTVGNGGPGPATPVQPPAEADNLATGAKTSQSSTATGSAPSRAVDGGTAQLMGTVARTVSQRQPWWQVDLGYVTAIGGVSVWVAGSGQQAEHLHVLVSDVPFYGASLSAARSTPGVLDVAPVPGTNGVTNVTVNRTGRFVRIQLDTTDALALAEVKVWPAAMTNIAPSGRAEQSSTWAWPESPAARAVDGSTDGDWQHGSVAHTLMDPQPWWQLDLGSSQTISTIALWNRTDCCPERLTDAHVLVSDVPFSETSLDAARSTPGVLEVVVPGAAGLPSSVSINRSGRYVRVQLAATGYLALAEVQVWSPERTNLAQGKPVTAMSSVEGYGWAARTLTDGVLGPYGWSSTAGLSRDHTEWVRVDLRRRTRVGAVVLYPRTDDPGAGIAANVDVRVSTDGRSWTTVASTRGDVSMSSAPRALYFAPVSARFVEVRGNGLRANVKDPGGLYRFQLAELAVLGPPAGA